MLERRRAWVCGAEPLSYQRVVDIEERLNLEIEPNTPINIEICYAFLEYELTKNFT